MENYQQLKKLAIIRLTVSFLVYISFFIGMLMVVFGVIYFRQWKQTSKPETKSLALNLLVPGVLLLVLFINLIIYYIYLVRKKILGLIKKDNKLTVQQKDDLYLTSGFVYIPYLLNDINFLNIVSTYNPHK